MNHMHNIAPSTISAAPNTLLRDRSALYLPTIAQAKVGQHMTCPDEYSDFGITPTQL
jgi:hypothetical protein